MRKKVFVFFESIKRGTDQSFLDCFVSAYKSFLTLSFCLFVHGLCPPFLSSSVYLSVRTSHSYTDAKTQCRLDEKIHSRQKQNILIKNPVKSVMQFGV